MRFITTIIFLLLFQTSFGQSWHVHSIDINGTVRDTIWVKSNSDTAYRKVNGLYVPRFKMRIMNGIVSAGSNYAATAHVHAYSSLTGLPTIPTNTNQLTNGANFITGITGSNVTTALGFTPYNATNPNGYISAVPAQSFASITGKPTTLSGYGITDAAALVHTHAYAPLTGGTLTTTSVNGVTLQNAGSTAAYLNQAGNYTIPIPAVSSSRTLYTLALNVPNITTSYANVTGLSFAVVAATTYRFYALIPYTAAATTTGSRWSITGPAATLISYTSSYTLTATTQTVNYLSAYDLPAVANATSLATGNIAMIQGFITPSASGTVTIRFASEVAASAITALAGATLEVW